MNLPVKLTLASSSLWFADKTFDAVRDHYMPDAFGDDQWLVWASISFIAAILSATAWWAIHRCIAIFRRAPVACQISSSDGGR